LQRQLCVFNTVEDFWMYYRNVPPPSAVFYDGMKREKRRVGKDGEERAIECFSLFKKDIEPSWEDDSNIRGGEWWLRKAVQPGQLDSLWQNLVSGAVSGRPRWELQNAQCIDVSLSAVSGAGACRVHN
jgi:hypothetical protein